MGWSVQFARVGNYRLDVRQTAVWRKEQERFAGGWSYELWWDTETATTCVGKGSDVYDDVYEARQAAVLHLANILPKAKSERLLAGQAELVWDERTYGSSIPANATVMSLKKKAAKYEQRAETESEPLATLLRSRAKRYRARIAKMRSGRKRR